MRCLDQDLVELVGRGLEGCFTRALRVSARKKRRTASWQVGQVGDWRREKRASGQGRMKYSGRKGPRTLALMRMKRRIVARSKRRGNWAFKTALHAPASLPWLPRTCHSKLGSQAASASSFAPHAPSTPPLHTTTNRYRASATSPCASVRGRQDLYWCTRKASQLSTCARKKARLSEAAAPEPLPDKR
jgi:hypothetical protein